MKKDEVRRCKKCGKKLGKYDKGNKCLACREADAEHRKEVAKKAAAPALAIGAGAVKVITNPKLREKAIRGAKVATDVVVNVIKNIT